MQIHLGLYCVQILLRLILKLDTIRHYIQ